MWLYRPISHKIKISCLSDIVWDSQASDFVNEPVKERSRFSWMEAAGWLRVESMNQRALVIMSLIEEKKKNPFLSKSARPRARR